VKKLGRPKEDRNEVLYVRISKENDRFLKKVDRGMRSNFINKLLDYCREKNLVDRLLKEIKA